MRRNTPWVIAIDGLDGTGKSTAVRLLAEALNAPAMSSPPASLRGERCLADALPEAERRAWYMNANSVAMREARTLADRDLVVMDRSIASTLAFGMAVRGRVASTADIPCGADLPEFRFLLRVEESVRVQRIWGRGEGRTREEMRLEEDHDFRARVMAGFANICTHEMDASETPDAICRRMAERVRAALQGERRAG